MNKNKKRAWKNRNFDCVYTINHTPCCVGKFKAATYPVSWNENATADQDINQGATYAVTSFLGIWTTGANNMLETINLTFLNIRVHPYRRLYSDTRKYKRTSAVQNCLCPNMKMQTKMIIWHVPLSTGRTLMQPSWKRMDRTELVSLSIQFDQPMLSCSPTGSLDTTFKTGRAATSEGICRDEFQ